MQRPPLPDYGPGWGGGERRPALTPHHSVGSLTADLCAFTRQNSWENGLRETGSWGGGLGAVMSRIGSWFPNLCFTHTVFFSVLRRKQSLWKQGWGKWKIKRAGLNPSGVFRPLCSDGNCEVPSREWYTARPRPILFPRLPMTMLLEGGRRGRLLLRLRPTCPCTPPPPSSLQVQC